MKNRFTGLFSLILCSLILTGCLSSTTVQPILMSGLNALRPAPSAKIPAVHLEPSTPARERFYDALNSWNGATISEILAIWGQPTEIQNIVAIGIPIEIYIYERPNSPKTSGARPCMVTVAVNPYNIAYPVVADDWLNCTETEPFPHNPARERFYDALETWKGAPISELLASWGEPTEIHEGDMYTYMRPIPPSGFSAFLFPKDDLPCTVTAVLKPKKTDNLISIVLVDDWLDCKKTKPFPSRPKP